MLKTIKRLVWALVWGLISIVFLYTFHYSGYIGELICGVVALINAMQELIKAYI